MTIKNHSIKLYAVGAAMAALCLIVQAGARTVKVSEFGFDANDSTRFLQGRP